MLFELSIDNLALSPHSKEVPGSIPGFACSLCVHSGFTHNSETCSIGELEMLNDP